MRPGIFGLLQPQSNALANTALHTSQQQDDSGVRAGIFDALMTEYTAGENPPPQEIPHTKNISQTITNFRNISAPLMNIVASGEGEQPSPDNVNDNNSGWMNLFASSRRLNVQRHSEEAMPESDFDAGVVEVAADDDTQHALKPESMSREILPDMAGTKPETVNEPASPAVNAPVMTESDSPEYVPVGEMNDARTTITRDNVQDIQPDIMSNKSPEIHQAMNTPETSQEISQATHTPETLQEISQPAHDAETHSAQPTISPQTMKAENFPDESLSDGTDDMTQPALNLTAHATANDSHIPSAPESDTPKYVPSDGTNDTRAIITGDNAQDIRPKITENDSQEVSQAMNTPETLQEISQPVRNPETPLAQPPITPEIMKAVDVLTEALRDDTADITQPALNLVALLMANNDTPITQAITPAPDSDTPEYVADIDGMNDTLATIAGDNTQGIQLNITGNEAPEFTQAIHAPETSQPFSQAMNVSDTLQRVSQATHTPYTQPVYSPETQLTMPHITPDIMKAVDVLAEALNDDEAEITQPTLNLVALLTANIDAPITQGITPAPDSDTPEYVVDIDGMNDTLATIAGDNTQGIQPNITGNEAPEFTQAIHAPETSQEFSQVMNASDTLPETQATHDTETQPATPHITPEILKAVDVLAEALNDEASDVTQPAQNLLSLLNAHTTGNDTPISPDDSHITAEPQNLTQESRAEFTPNDDAPELPRQHTPRKHETPPAIPSITPEITQAVNVLTEAINDGDTDIRQPAQELVSLLTAQNDSSMSVETPSLEITPAVNPTETPRENREDEAPIDDDRNEITHDPLNMAETFGELAGVQNVAQESQMPAQNDSGSQATHTQSHERPRISRAESPRINRESHSGITEADADSHDDSTPITFTRNATGQDSRNDTSAGHEGRQYTPNNDSPAQVQSQNSRSNNATSPTSKQEAPRTANERNTTARTEAHNDFASFFDGVIRTRRTASRTPAQPLSLRTAEYTPTRSGIVREGIVNTVRFIRADGVRKANIIIDPPALGRISVEIVSSSSGVEASVKVASEQIRQIVQEQITQLRDNLSQQGVQVSEFTVDVQQDSTGQGQNSGHEDRRSPYSFTAPENDDDAEEFRIDLEEGLLYWVA